jgi:DMSO/TMAO reductase YedYZ molybdopterin-dependent catalytic subunit
MSDIEKGRPARRGVALGGAAVVAGLTLALSLAGVGMPARGASGSEAVASESSAQDGEAGAQQSSADLDAAANQWIADTNAALDQQSVDYAPVVTELPDGTLVQRTPTDLGGYFQMGNNTNLNYNTYYLDADNRGCGSCHQDLAQTVRDMDFYHLELSNGKNHTVTVDECRLCHDQGYGYIETTQEFGTLIHGIHNKNGVVSNCMSCHTATSNGQGLQLWDDVKYDHLQGIVDIAAEKASDYGIDFGYNQDKTYDMFDASWWYTDGSVQNIARGETDTPLDDATFDDWDVTVDGLVNEPFTEKLPDLIDEAPVETFTTTIECIMNASGGEAITNVECKGIPISWLLEKAGGVKDGATAIMSVAPDGWSRGEPIEQLDKAGGYLVYEMNGKRLDWKNGYPLMSVYPGTAAPGCIRWVSELTVVDTPLSELKIWTGWTTDKDSDTGVNDVNGGHMYAYSSSQIDNDMGLVYVNKPSTGIMEIQEGQVIETGKPFTFQGYAYAFDEKVTSVEFSLDGGESWLSYDTSDSDYTKWVWWNFTFTPQTDGAYVLRVRATTETGKTSYTPDVVMVNAKTADEIADLKASLSQDASASSED